MKKATIVVSCAVAFAAALAAIDYQYDKSRKAKAQNQESAEVAKQKQEYDTRIVPALRDIALDRCGNKDAALHGLLAAKFIYDSNADDDVRKLLKQNKIDPHHYGLHEMPGGDGYLSLEQATQFAQFLIKNNILATAEPDRHNGQIQAEYVNNGTGGGRLVFYYQPAPSDYDGKNKPWIPDLKDPVAGQKNQAPTPNKPIPADGIYVPNSAAMGTFLMELMSGKYDYISTHAVIKVPGTENQWQVKSEALIMDGPAAPERLQPPVLKR